MTPRRLLVLFLALTLSFAAPAGSLRAEDEPAHDEDSKPAPPKPAKKKKPSKKKAFDYERSKYKSKEISQTPTYKFNEKGEPIHADAKKKKASAKKKRSEPPEMGSEDSSCGSEDSCAEKKSEADAL